ncbi:acetyltransferase [Paenibacillus helianthi]|uniref:Acetyltransferase n=1 Tax=Paenibacillus helianthi TaxID=1349432 RepID=A0ABX3ERD5_9BACL|nr:GNAT family N-acetyltransferase [Paenibacillus helianthi]OKP88590.1 acetyltransferase [Paenibacillus helianthi]
MKIRPLNSNEEIPFDLLLLADPSKEIVKEYLGRGQCLVALINEEIIGVLVLIRTRPETIEIVNIAVQEDYQGIGIGKKLIVYSIDKAREEKAKTIEIGTGNSSVHQLMLYQRCGFRITGIDRDFFVRHYKEEIYENGIQCRDMIRLSLDL